MKRKYERYEARMGKPVTAAYIYIRVSTLDQAEEGYSLAAQERKLREYCEKHKYRIIGLYADRGISGKDIEHRPEMRRLIDDIKNGGDDEKKIVIVWKLSRFSRCLLDLVETCETMEAFNTFLISYSEPFDSSTPMGRLIRGILGLVAQFEREIISENVMLGMAERARQGKPTVSYILGYDKHNKDTFTINPAEAEYFLFAARTYLERKNLSETAKLCDERGYRGKMGARPIPSTLLPLLVNPFFCGYNTFCGHLYRGTHPQLISVEMHNKIIRTLKSQGKLTGRNRKCLLYYYVDKNKDVITIPGL